MPSIKEVNLAIYRNFFSQFRHALVPNTTTVFAWEADLLGLSSRFLTHEFEIKRNYKDFKADFKKEKHRILQEKYEKKVPYFEKPEYVKNWEMQYPDRPTFWTPKIVEDVPNYFWFVIAGFEIPKEAIPEYAGLIEIRNGFVYRQVIAPKIHTGKITEKARETLYRSMCARYWVWVEESFKRVRNEE